MRERKEREEQEGGMRKSMKRKEYEREITERNKIKK
jgi:hypothetical protein